MTDEVRRRLLDEGWDQGGRVFGPEEMGLINGQGTVLGSTSVEKKKSVTGNIRKRPRQSTFQAFLRDYTETLKVAGVGFLVGALVPTAIFFARQSGKKKGRR